MNMNCGEPEQNLGTGRDDGRSVSARADRVKVWCLLLTAVVCVYAVLTFRRNAVWRSEISLWSDAIRKSPAKGRPYSARGAAYTRQGQYAKAMADLDRAIQLSPALWAAYNNRANLHEKAGRYSQAMVDYDRAIELNPKYAEAFYNRGTCLLTTGQVKLAVAALTRAIELKPRRADAWINRGAAHLRLAQFDQATDDLSRGLQLAPNHAGAYLNRAMAHLLAGRQNKARADAAACRLLGGDTSEFKRLRRSMGVSQKMRSAGQIQQGQSHGVTKP